MYRPVQVLSPMINSSPALLQSLSSKSEDEEDRDALESVREPLSCVVSMCSFCVVRHSMSNNLLVSLAHHAVLWYGHSRTQPEHAHVHNYTYWYMKLKLVHRDRSFVVYSTQLY